MTDRLWLTDFKYDDGAMLVKKTGARIPLTFSLINDVFTWLTPGASGAGSRGTSARPSLSTRTSRAPGISSGR